MVWADEGVGTVCLFQVQSIQLLHLVSTSLVQRCVMIVLCANDYLKAIAISVFGKFQVRIKSISASQFLVVCEDPESRSNSHVKACDRKCQ